MKFSEQRKSLLSSQARVQVPWVKVTIGKYTFGAFDRTTRESNKDNQGFYTPYKIQYPNYINSLSIIKINGQVNQYTLSLSYPVRDTDDPNFFEKVLSSVSSTREITFSYGDVSQPAFIYKEEKAIITDTSSSFNFQNGQVGGVINYTIKAVSGAALNTDACRTFFATGAKVKPSDEIKKLFRTTKSLRNTFTGMNERNLNKLIDGGDQYVKLETKQNISVLDYISYLVSCMIPQGTAPGLSKDIYILTIHDDTVYKDMTDDTLPGPYFKVTRTSYVSQQSDAYEIDVGYNNSTIVSNLQINNNENYSLYYDYQNELYPENYVRRLNKDGQWEEVYAPTMTSKNNTFETRPDDLTWWTKITKYPISASITIQGLLRPATLMSYVRLNVIFPGGHKHISSGLYIVTRQQDTIDSSGYRTTLSLTKIAGDNYIKTNPSK